MRDLILAAAAPLLVAGIAVSYPTDPPPQAIGDLRVAANCAAWQRVASLVVTGTHAGDELTGPFRETIDVRGGASATVVHEGPLVNAAGYDGRTAWSQDFSGASHDLDAAHARALARTDAWLDRRGWCASGDATQYRSRDTYVAGSRTFDVVTATPLHGVPVTIWIDGASHLIERTDERLNESREVTTTTDWRTVGDVPYPFAKRVDYPEDEATESYSVRSVAIGPALAPQTFARPALPRDVRMRGSLTVVPYREEGDKPIVDVMLNGRGPFPFVLDTGGHFILTPATLRRLGIAGIGGGTETGQGTAVRRTRFARVRELRIGDAIVTNQIATVIPYGFRRLERGPRPAKAGWLGLQFFERFATTFDPSTRRLTLAPLDQPRSTPRGVRLPLTFDEDAPLVDCTIDARPGPCMIDTGNAGGTIVEGDWAARNRLVPRLLRKALAIEDEAIGRADLTLGPLVESHQPIEYQKPSTRGSESTTVEAGILSEALLDRFVMTVDYGRRSLWLRPLPDRKPEPFDRAGVEVDKERNGEFSVWLLLPHSPAANAGLRIGDRIVAVDGIASKGLAGSDFHARSEGAVGSRLTYRIVRKNTKPFDVMIRLRELLP